MSVTYKKCHEAFIKDKMVDMVSMEDIRPTGRHYVMHLRLKSNVHGVVERIPTHLVPFDTYSAYDTFVTHNVAIDPETRQPMPPSFNKRVQLYKSVLDTFGTDFEPKSDELSDIFTRYLKGQSIALTERMYLRSYLHVDDTNVIHEFDASGLDIRPLVEAKLKEMGVGTWTLRRSSFADSSLVKTKVLSLMAPDAFHHLPLFHVSGLGYYTTNTVERGVAMPGLEDGEPRTSLPPFVTVYPCFIDLLEALQKMCHFSFEKYCDGK
jgi:hypothetical protein